MYTFQTNLAPEVHDLFIKEHPMCNLLQSSDWAKIKDNWTHEIVGAFDGNTLVASASILIKHLPLGFTMFYIPRGPILDYRNKKLLDFFIDNIKQLAKKNRAVFIKIDPAIHYRDFYLGEDQIINADASKKIGALLHTGAKWKGLSMDMSETVQPRFQANVHSKEFSEEILSKKTRQMLRTARNKGIKIQIGSTELLQDFTRLMNLTEERKNVRLRSGNEGSYYQKLLDTYQSNAFIVLATLPLKELLEKTQTKLTETISEISNLKENQVKKRHNLEELQSSLTREVTELTEKVEIYGENVAIAGTLSIIFGGTSEILYAGMDDSFKRYMPAYLSWFETIQECFRRGATSSNMGGLEGSLNDGLLKFKNNFHPVIEEFIGEFDLPVNPIFFQLGELAYKFRKSLKKKS